MDLRQTIESLLAAHFGTSVQVARIEQRPFAHQTSHAMHAVDIELHDGAIVSSTSLMVRGAAAAEAAEYGRRHAQLGVGLHLDLAEWIYRNAEWVPLYQVVDPADPAAVEKEVRRQLEAFVVLMGRSPTHIDSHQHLHRNDPLRGIAQRAAEELKVPLRHFSTVHYCGDFYGQSGKGYSLPEAITAEALVSVVRCLPEGVTELTCHPGYAEDLETAYRTERAREIAALCNARVQRFVIEQQIALTNFSAIATSVSNPAWQIAASRPPTARP